MMQHQFSTLQGAGTSDIPIFPYESLAIITACAVRGVRCVAAPVAVLNGGHYLIDVIAGAMVAIIAIAAARTRPSLRPRSYTG